MGPSSYLIEEKNVDQYQTIENMKIIFDNYVYWYFSFNIFTTWINVFALGDESCAAVSSLNLKIRKVLGSENVDTLPLPVTKNIWTQSGNIKSSSASRAPPVGCDGL